MGEDVNGLNNARETGFFGLFKKEQEKASQTQNSDIITPQNSNIITPQNSKPLACTYNNIHLPECQELQRIQNEAMTKIHYQVADPYTSTSPTYIQLNTENHDFPRLSGCIKYAGKYYGIDQQGNKMPNVSQSACRRWIENSERPFDYFANNQRSNYSEDKNRDNESSKLKIVTDQQDQKNYQYMQNTIN